MPSYPSNKCRPEEDKEQEIKLLLENIPIFLSYPINFYFNARSPQRSLEHGARGHKPHQFEAAGAGFLIERIIGK
jgi:hypothetical protein